MDRIIADEFRASFRGVRRRGPQPSEKGLANARCFYTSLSRSFFDNEVQKIMLTRLEGAVCYEIIKPDSPRAKSFIQEYKEMVNLPPIETLVQIERIAFPMWAWAALDRLASEATHGMHSLNHDDAMYVYNQDPGFCAELLSVLTQFHTRPQHEHGVGERLAEVVTTWRSNFDHTEFIRTRFRSNKRIDSSKFIRRPTKWDQIAAFLNEDLKPQKGHEVKGDTLRKSILPNEVNRRTKILDTWQYHIRAQTVLEFIRRAPPWMS